MDPLTHGLASFALTRSLFPRAPKRTLLFAIAAGIVADIDLCSSWFGPSAFFHWHRTLTHSLLGSLLLATIFVIALIALSRSASKEKPLLLLSALPVFSTVALHLAMDLCQSDGLVLFWPFRPRVYSADWLAHLDLWILAILLFGILLPRLFAMVTSEIGAREKGPKGRFGATLSLVVVILYIVARATLHGNAVATLESRTYRGEVPRHSAAIPSSASLFQWLGIVETERALHEIAIDVTPGVVFDSDSAVTLYKPESSPALDAAKNSATARQFLQKVRFPRATIEKTTTGFRVELLGFPYRDDSAFGRRVVAVIETDANAKVTDAELIWGAASKQN